MINDLRKRFIVFSVLVISSIIIIIGLFLLVGSPRHSLENISTHRYWITLLLGITLVFIGSLLLSKKAVRPIEQAWQKQLDFTADASHELRTPIAVIQTNLELVIDSPKETIESQMKWLKNIETENKRMAKLVTDLLTLSRADTSQQMLEIETFMLDEVICEVLTPFEAIAYEKNIELKINSNSKIAFCGDLKRIKQLIVILVDNALNYTNAPGIVTISLSNDDEEIIFMVSDTGYGIESEHLDKIFDRFYRVTTTRKLNQDGSGLGLSIAKWVVQEHGGTIEVESTLDVGTTFTVRLPILIKSKKRSNSTASINSSIFLLLFSR